MIPFLRLVQKSACREEVLEYVQAASSELWVTPEPHRPTHLELPLSLFAKDKVFTDVIKRFDVGHRIKAFQFAPHTSYDWHCDGNSRTTAINLQLNAFGTSGVLYGQDKPGAQTHTEVRLLAHERDSYYLVDLQTPHMVVNLSDTTRYVVTVGFTVDYDAMRRKLFRHIDFSTCGVKPNED
jgi:hypothetical protein